MIEYLLLFIGLPYIWGGNNPLMGFDCSGLVCEALRAEGIIGHKVDLSSQGIYNELVQKSFMSVSRHQVRRDDILFFGPAAYDINHVAIAYNSFQMLEAGGGDSTTRTLEDATKRNAFVRLRPIANRKDFTAAIRLNR